LAEKTLALIWRNYLDVGYRKLIYTKTNSVCSVEELVAAIGGRPRVVAVLLGATDHTIRKRHLREIGSAPEEQFARSRRAALRLKKEAAEWVVGVSTDARTVVSIAEELIELMGWR